MRFAGLVPSQNLRVFRYPDIDHFQQGLRGASVDFVPLAKIDGPIGQAMLSLPGCDLYLLHTFPRIVQAMLESSYAFVMLSMKDLPSAIFNGQEAEPSSLQFARGRAEYRAVERESGYFAALSFSPLVENRGWPESRSEFRTIPIPRDLELQLRASILRVFVAASHAPELTVIPGAGAGLVDSVLEVLDRIFDGYLCAKSFKREGVQDSLRALRMIDDLLDSNSLGPIYSGEIASKLGVSVRTLSNLMVRVHGMSLHRYIRARRLWKVRRQLLAGEPRQIKEIALSNGFWHLGDFAARYASQFGELPSSTQVQAQLRR
jgi:AraC-like DNA-binding protein